MSLLIFTYRRQQIISQKSVLNAKLLDLNKKLMDLQSYAANIADGTVSINDLMSAPPSLFSRMTMFMNYSHQSSYAMAQERFNPTMAAAQAQGIFATMQPEMQQQYQQLIFKNLYDQSRQQFAEVEKKIMDKEGTKIEQERAQIETQLQMLAAEEKTVTDAETKEAENSAPKYVA